MGEKSESADSSSPERQTGFFRSKLAKYLYGNVTLIGFLSLIWLLMRSGRKPSRLNYPCQRTALANVALLTGGTALPIASRIPRFFSRDSQREWIKRLVRLVEFAGFAVLIGLLAITLAGLGNETYDIPGGRSLDEMRSAAAVLSFPQFDSSSPDASDIYIADEIPPSSEHGIGTLIDVMNDNGLVFYQDGDQGDTHAPEGLIDKDDVVLIKVNGEWQDRGGTNTDVVKGLIDAIVNHPDGFTGEIAIVENGQWDTYMDNRPDNRNPDRCNSEDRTQSFNDVALMFVDEYRVSVYDWTAIQSDVVGEFSQGDPRDGYVYVPEKEIGYPKFTTSYGTRISLRHGVWDGSRYDNDSLKFINVPVLKSHSGLGVTAAVKHFMGVQDRWKNTDSAPHVPMQKQGFMGEMMLLARYPDLNIVDAIWVCPGASGPRAPYDSAVRVDALLASQDPIALDYYCGKHVLLPISGWGRHDPDCTNSENPGGGNDYSDGTPCTGSDYNAFHQMIESTYHVLADAGKQVTMDTDNMDVHKGSSPQEPTHLEHQYFLAEGCTAHGFETWIMVANPNDEPADVHVSYLTESECLNRNPVRVEPRSRLTVNASDDVSESDTGIVVGSEIPLYVERSMFWSERTDGHVTIATEQGSREWYLADGCTGHGFETWVQVINPTSWEIKASLTHLTTDGVQPGPDLAIPAWSRRTVNVNEYVPPGDVSTIVTSPAPVVVECSLYRDDRRGGYCSLGARTPSSEWYFAEGCTHSGYETYLLLMNPQEFETSVNVDLMSASTAGSDTAGTQITVPARSRTTVRVNDLVPGSDVSSVIKADAPIFAQRSMIWPAEKGKAIHGSIGTNSPSSRIFLAEGCTEHGFETWLLVQNPTREVAHVSLNAMTVSGVITIDEFQLDSEKRRSIRLNDFYSGDLSLMVDATGGVCAERSMYWGNRSGGTCSLGFSQ